MYLYKNKDFCIILGKIKPNEAALGDIKGNDSQERWGWEDDQFSPIPTSLGLNPNPNEHSVLLCQRVTNCIFLDTCPNI